MSGLICGVLLLILAGAVLRGYRRGFLRMALSLSSLLLTVILVGFLHPAVTEVLRNDTPLEDVIASTIYRNLEPTLSGGEETVTEEEQISLLEEWNFPDRIREEITEETEQAAETFAHRTSETLAALILEIAGYLLTFLLVFAAIRALCLLLGLVEHIPVVHGFNKILGALLGLIQGGFLLWILCLLVTLLLPSGIGTQILAAVSGNPLLSLLYNTSLSLF